MLQNMKISVRLTLLVVLTTIIVIIVGSLGHLAGRKALDSVHELYYGGLNSIGSLSNISELYNEAFAAAYKVTKGGSFEEGIQHIEQVPIRANKHLDDYKSTLHSEEEIKEFEHFEKAVQNTNSDLVRLIEIMRKQDAQSLKNYWSDEFSSSRLDFNTEIRRFINLHIRLGKKVYDQAIEDYEIIDNIMIAGIILGVILTVLFSYIIIRSITKPLGEALYTVDQVAAGDVNVKLVSNTNDEVGKLSGSLQKMINSNQSMVMSLAQVAKGDLTGNVEVRSDKDLLGETINEMIAKLQIMISEIIGEVEVLTTSSAEINTSVTQVSSGASETAAAVTETTTTVEELKQTAQVSADKAKEVLTSAEETIKIVKANEQSLKSTIEDMNQIQDKVRIVSDTIIKLNEHGLAIGEIINTVNELAEQSNLLAVNAAIEAAKAGDQGKSFGVVAQEIRTMAEQSKAATVQVKAILNDIQNSTSAAVMASEQGSKAVEKGVMQSSQTSKAMAQLSTSISGVAQSAKQISISSQQQLIGVEQVTTAMANINEATSQHVEHMRQIEIAVSSLTDVSKALEALTNKYKLNKEMYNRKEELDSSFSRKNRALQMKSSNQKKMSFSE